MPRLPRPFVALALGALALLAPAGVAAHAELVLANPAPGIGLFQAPSAVAIEFSEPLNLSLSRIEVLDSSGLDVGQGPTLAVEGDPRAMRRPLGLLPTGQYIVRWTSVSTLDGHTLKGSYSFAVGTAASGHTEIASGPLDSEGPFGLLGRFGALIALGMWFAGSFLRGVSRQASLDPAKTKRIVRAAPAIAFAGTVVSLASSTLVATGSLTSIGGTVASPSGEARLGVLGATALGVLVGARPPLISVLLAGAAIAADAASGHAAASPLPPLGIASFSLHLAAVGVWTWVIAGSLFAAADLRRALGTFMPYAVAAAGVVAASGIVNAALLLTGPSDLVATDYGRVLVAKSAAFVAMAGFGLRHFLSRRRAHIPDGRLRLPLRSEALAATLALALATVLVGFPNPPREAEGRAARLSTSDPVLAELGGRDALSIADGSGPFVVGLTILPPSPGAVEIHVQVIGVEAGDGLRNARLVGSSGAASIDVPLAGGCGLGCFTGHASFSEAGSWRLEVHVDSNRGPIATAEEVPLPAPDGSAAFGRTLAAEEALRTAVLTEHLSGSVGGPTYVTAYLFEAPDRLQLASGDTSRIIIGEEEWERTGSGAWTTSSFPAPGFSWPAGYYRQFWGNPVAIKLLGTQKLDGDLTQIIAFLRPDIPAWFRLWVRADGVVLRMEMRAEGHIMDHAYADLNAPITVTPPAS